jgi:hypothetical protein
MAKDAEPLYAGRACLRPREQSAWMDVLQPGRVFQCFRQKMKREGRMSGAGRVTALSIDQFWDGGAFLKMN